jgi:hypothetical protein
MPRPTAEQYKDELIMRKIDLDRYAEGMAAYTLAVVNRLNERISKYLIRNGAIESKKQFNASMRRIKPWIVQARNGLYETFQKEIHAFVKEEKAWIYGNSPIKLKKADKNRTKKIESSIFFEAYSDTDTFRGYVTRLFNQIYQTWRSQLTIAHRTGQRIEDVVKLTAGAE